METMCTRICQYALLLAAALPAQSLLPNDLPASMVSEGAGVQSVSAAGPGFTQALRVTTSQPGRVLADATLSWTNAVPLGAGDRLTLTFWVRKVAPADLYNLRATVSLETDGAAPWLETVFPCNLSTWAKYSFPVVAPAALDTSALRLIFRHGLGPQTYELGGIQLVNRGAPGPPPAPVESLIPLNSARTYSAFFDNSVGGGSAQVVPASGPGLTEAIQIQVNGTSPFIYNAQLGWVTTAAVNKNDAVLLSFYARLLQGKDQGPLMGQVVYERNSAPNDKSVTFFFPLVNDEWQLLQVPFHANDNYQPRTAHLQFQFAAGPQRFEIANVELLNYGPLADLGRLPNRPAVVVDPAQERILSQARQRIEDMRQTPLKVIVVDAAGKPMPDVEVRMQQLRHAFRFGTAVTANGLKQPGQDNEIYRSRIASHFTTSVLENDLKWPLWECATCRPSFEQAQTREGIQWLLSHDIAVRGHNLIWPSNRNMPADVQRLTGDALRTRITQHFENVLSDPGVAGKLYQWDVVNEPFDNFDVQGRLDGVNGVVPSKGQLGNEELLAWFRHARKLDPMAQLVLNDYANIESANVASHEDYFVRVLQWMRQNNAPLDAIGLQAHFGGTRPLSRVQTVIDRFAKFGLPLAITEYDYNSSDEAAQAAFTKDFMTLVFSRPEFTDYLMWGFWASRHWLPPGAMYAADWTSKPNALAYNRLLFQEWWTNAEGRTAEDGSVTRRVYQGDYQITVVGAEGPVVQTMRIVEPGVVTVVIPAT